MKCECWMAKVLKKKTVEIIYWISHEGTAERKVEIGYCQNAWNMYEMPNAHFIDGVK